MMRQAKANNAGAVMDADRKTVGLVVSTMRSGSTLLKALMAEGEDVSNLPEINFQRFRGPTAEEQISKLSDRQIIVLKRPAWYQELASYPRLPLLSDVRVFVLVRDVYETVCSLRKMSLGRAAGWLGPWFDRFLVNRYWYQITSRICQLGDDMGERAHRVRYEDVVSNPIATTRVLFAFLGSSCCEGVDRYRPPADFKWTWGRDDASGNIKSLRVQAPRERGYTDRHLLQTIRASQRVCELRERLGYPELPS